MFENIKGGFEMIRGSWKILLSDRKLLVFPVLSMIISFVLIALAVLSLYLLFAGKIFASDILLGFILVIILLIIIFLAFYVMDAFLSAALVWSVYSLIHGKTPLIKEGLLQAALHISPLVIWAFIAATVGVFISIISAIAESVSGNLASVLFGIQEAAWELVTLFVIPFIVIDGESATGSMKKSVDLFTRTWGKSMFGWGSIGIVFVGIGLIAFFLWCGIIAYTPDFLSQESVITAWIAVTAIFALFLAALFVIYSTMTGIFVTVLFSYAKTGMVPSCMNKELVEKAFVPKQNKGGVL